MCSIDIKEHYKYDLKYLICFYYLLMYLSEKDYILSEIYKCCYLILK